MFSHIIKAAMCIIVFIAGMFYLKGFVDPERAKRTLEAAGYTEIQFHGSDLFNCSEDEFSRDKFTAIGLNGRPVSGVVCAGLFFKGSTIRLD